MSIKSGAIQTTVDEALKGLNFLEAINTLGRDPKLIASMKSELIEASTISAQRKKEAQDAEDVITASQKAFTELLVKEKQHNEQVKSDHGKLDAKKEEVFNLLQSLETEKEGFRNEVTTAHEQLDAKKQEVQSIATSAEARHKAADTRESDLNSRENDHINDVKRFELSRQRHRDEVEAFRKRREKLAAVASEVEQEE